MRGRPPYSTMSPIDFTIDTKLLECSYDPTENSLLTCILEDHNSIQKEAEYVSFIHVEPTNNYRSSFFYLYKRFRDFEILSCLKII